MLLKPNGVYSQISWQKEPPFVEQEAKPIDSELARKGLLAIHKVADQDKEHDEDVEMHRRRYEEVVSQEQEGLSPIS